jgi:hypothetical protein
MPSRPAVLIVALLCAACDRPSEAAVEPVEPSPSTEAASPGPEPSASPGFSSEPRPERGRDSLPAALRPQLPVRGLYAAGGGIVSGAWRAVVDLDSQQLSWGRSASHGSSSIGAMEREGNAPLSSGDLTELIGLADTAWREPPEVDPPDPIVDYGEILVLCDGEQVFFHDGYGPITLPAAAAVLARLKALTEPLDSPD